MSIISILSEKGMPNLNSSADSATSGLSSAPDLLQSYKAAASGGTAMHRWVQSSSLILVLLIALPAASDDQQKAQKELNKVAAMATDPTARRAVSLAVSEALSVGRPELVQQRRAMDLNYGELFVAFRLVKSGAKTDDIVAQRKASKDIWQIAREQKANWKEIAADARKLNNKVNDKLLMYFTNRKTTFQRDLADNYDPLADSVMADSKISQKEISDAETRYQFLRDHAGVNVDSHMDSAAENAARAGRPDPIRTGGPQSSNTNKPTTGPKN
jgi:hypothetical protein